MDDILKRAITETFDLKQLIELRNRAAHDYVSGLSITSMTMSSSSWSGMVTASPKELLNLLQPLIESKDDRPIVEQPMSRPVDHSRKIITT